MTEPLWLDQYSWINQWLNIKFYQISVWYDLNGLYRIWSTILSNLIRAKERVFRILINCKILNDTVINYEYCAEILQNNFNFMTAKLTKERDIFSY